MCTARPRWNGVRSRQARRPKRRRRRSHHHRLGPCCGRDSAAAACRNSPIKIPPVRLSRSLARWAWSTPPSRWWPRPSPASRRGSDSQASSECGSSCPPNSGPRTVLSRIGWSLDQTQLRLSEKPNVPEYDRFSPTYFRYRPCFYQWICHPILW